MKMTEAQEELLQACKTANLEVGLALEIGLTCVNDGHAREMAKYIRQYPNNEDEVYIAKAYEIIGETRPEYVVEGDDE